MNKAIVLLSGGVDSATCLGLAVGSHGKENVAALSVFYGQRHAKEQQCARKVAEYYGVPLYEVDLSSTMQYSNCSLLKQSTEEVVHKSYAEQQAEKPGTVSTYVPFRNGLMLSAAGALALSLFDDGEVELYYGAHADDAAGRAYPDCTPEFVNAMCQALYEGSGRRLMLVAPLLNCNKTEVVATGLKIGVPYKYTWSCYEGGDHPCGKCGTCIDRAQAFYNNGVPDPALQED